ncbi:MULTISPECIES: BglG family transcription antiterminator [Oceanobacillus]|uniref:BglG family transcription antiterminator n=1 Tax=Oceanobacillus aidingensis TaxID=645964 RepID=A0ABV9K1A1_9BACI|nr:BglG family transcription antiterminator [Oceanobacillus oncorhynchi]MDM8101300.1 BglG family transcription antiterminator [Oceanobacillus oncorhynchi]UUI39412.1 BglG family transcription antiterminator [Oceanobacillus oncorhynchi]
MLENRMKMILRELMAAEAPVAGRYLAAVNHVTVRTTREDMKALSSLLKEHGGTIESLKGKGYQLKVIDEQYFRNFLKEISSHDQTVGEYVPRTPEERIKYIIIRLLLNQDYIKLDDLAEEMYISRSTIQNDLKHVRVILSAYEIDLDVRPNYGLKVKGDEMKIRFCMSEYIFDRKEEMGEQLGDLHLTSFDQKLLNVFLQIIMNQINFHQITLSDIALNNLLVHIVIAYKRTKSGHYVKLYNMDVQDILKQKEYKVAQEIVKEIEEKLEITFPQAEVAYITLHLLGTKMLSQANNAVEEVIDENILCYVSRALDKIDQEFNLGIKDDKELIFGLSLHLKPAVNRYKYGMNIRNPMLEEIKKNYPLAFEAAISAGLTISEEMGAEIDENEVGYIALHIGAAIERRKLMSGPKRCLIVCASGFGTAQLIYYKLKNQFGKELDVVGTTEYYKLRNYNLNNIDFIVSSIPISGEISVPVIQVNAILGENDLIKIGQFVEEKSQSINTYFNENLMFLRKEYQTMDEVLSFLNNELIKKGLVDDTFIEAVYEREEVAPTSYGNLVAIPHPITPKTEKTFLTICTLEKPIKWKDKPVQFICLLCVKKYSQEDLQGMYEMLGEIIDNSTLVKRLIKARNYKEFVENLK